ncbi:MAG: PD40 domain-containing protein [Acidobacteria bacterium]|nr:PD40 domain-containing protein [Acidobacteriota bacterium]
MQINNNRLILIALVISFICTGAISADSILRYPDIYNDTIVFSCGEDLWSVPVTGGIATRLTTNDGMERYPKFSPDGKLIAFTGEYDGNPDVYVMNRYGGEITRLTYHPGNDIVIGWHPIKNKIIFSSYRTSWDRNLKLFMVAPDGTGIEELPLYEASQGTFSPDGQKLAYNRLTREFRTWKRYKGGLAQDVYIYDFKTKYDEKVTKYEGTDRFPMWIGNKIYFSSDRTNTLNIWAYDTDAKALKQITKHTEYDVRWPSDGTDKIVYENGGSIWMLDLSTGKYNQVPIEVKTDHESIRPYFKSLKDNIMEYKLSPTAKRALIVARGEIFTVPLEEGRTYNIAGDVGTREKDAVWSPDSKTIAFFSDRGGEYNLYIEDTEGKTPVKKITSFSKGYRFALTFSPDSKKLSFTDQTLTLYYVDIASGKITTVEKAKYEHIDVSQDVKDLYDHTWSPDSRYIAYSMIDSSLVRKIYIYSLETGKSMCVSGDLYNDFNPVFTPDGKHLLFISNRRWNPVFGDFEWEMVFKKAAGIYAMALNKDSGSIFPLRDIDENTPAEKKDEKKEVKVKIDFDGIADRVEQFPLTSGNYRYLTVNGGNIFYTNSDEGDYNQFEFRGWGPVDLYKFSLKDKKESKLSSSIDKYSVSDDGSKLIYMKNQALYTISPAGSDEKPVDVSGLKVWMEPIKEWKQLFKEAWRLHRDYYYEPNMKGLDWKKMYEKYFKLIENATCREDAKYILGELVGELNTSHTYVYAGQDKRQADRIRVGMLGVDWKADEKSKRYTFGKIYRVADWATGSIPPLAGPDKKVNDGDYLIAVNGKNVTTDKNIYSYFQDLASKHITLTVNSKPELKGAWQVEVEPLASEGMLRHNYQVEQNRLTVEKESNGQIGYLYFPDTYLGSVYEFPKYFAQTQKKGILLDGRFNSGGLDPDIFLRRLYRKINGYWTRRYSHDQYTPRFATRAHLALLTDEHAGSGGDELPSEFQLHKMGPVIGKRTWGGLVGVSMFIQIMDGSFMTVPDYRIYNEKGEWIIENKGVKPDIEVELEHAQMERGYDAQLMEGIKYLMKKIKEEPRDWPVHQPFISE